MLICKDGVPNNVTTVSSIEQKVSLLAKLGYLINDKHAFFCDWRLLNS